MKKKKWIWTGIGVVVVAAAVLVFFLISPGKKNVVQAVPQTTAKVTKGDITVTVSGSGSVVTTNQESVRPTDEGKVKEVLVSTGQVVKKGQQLLTYEGADNSDQITQAEASLKSQNLDLENLQEQYKEKVQEGATELDLENVKNSIDKQELSISTSESQLTKLQEDAVPPAPLTAPIAGTVTTVSITAGEQVKEGTDLFVITDYQNLSVLTSVDELDIPQVKNGQAAKVTLDALPDQTFDGVVTNIAEEGTSTNGVSSFNVTVALKKSDGARVGMSAQASIIVNEKKDVLTLPIEAVQQRGNTYTVMLPTGTDTGTGTAAQSSGTAGAAGTSGEGAAAGSERTGGQFGYGRGGGQGGSGGTGTGEGQAAPNGYRRAGGTGTGGYGGGQGAGSREGFSFGGGQGSARQTGAASGGNSSRGAAAGASGVQMKVVQVGIHDENTIEIVSGLNEGDEVVVPTVRASSSSSSAQVQAGFGGFGGGFGGGGGLGGFGGGGLSSGTRSSFGGGGGRTGGGGSTGAGGGTGGGGR